MLKFENVSVEFRGTRVIHDISLAIPTGETHVLLGSSGSGKSTLLRMLVGLVRPSSGQVLVDGQPINPDDVSGYIKRVGYVIQEGGLFPHMTIRQNIVLSGARMQWPLEQLDAEIERLMQLSALSTDLLNRYPNQLSGGQRQRVAIIRALITDPEILLLDEPLGALDPVTRYDLQQELRTWFKELRKTVVFVTHDLAEAYYFGQRISLLHDGVIAQTGTAHDFITNPNDEYVRKFVSAHRVFSSEGEVM